MLAFLEKPAIIIFVRWTKRTQKLSNADWCNGSTADSDSVSRGSSPLSVVPWQGHRIPWKQRVEVSGTFIGVWLSLVERYVRDVEVAGSNPVTPTYPSFSRGIFFFLKSESRLLFQFCGYNRRTSVFKGMQWQEICISFYCTIKKTELYCGQQLLSKR